MGRHHAVDSVALGDMFDGRTKYNVPAYKGSYSWKRERAEDLWDDLMGGYLADPGSRGEEYLLGSVVLVRKDGDEYDVVDGQQRLVTLALLLCALRDSLRKHSEPVPGESDHLDVVAMIDGWTNRDGQMIRLSSGEDAEAFESVRRHPADHAEQRSGAIFRNYAMLRACADELCRKCKIGRPAEHKDGVSALRRILEDLRRKTSVVRVTIHGKGGSYQYQVFQSLNSKGQPLDQADLVKNHVLDNVDPGRRAEADRRWNGVMRKFILTDKSGGNDMEPDDIIYGSMLSRLAKDDAEVQKRDLCGAVKRIYGGHPGSMLEYVGRLEEDVGFVKALEHPSSVQMPARLGHAFRGLRQIRAACFKWPIIAACRAWGLGDARTVDLADCLVKFFFVYRTICRKDADPLKRCSICMAGQIAEGAGVGEVLRTLLREGAPPGGRERVGRGEFAEKFAGSVFDLGDDEATYVLASLERELQARRGRAADTAALQIDRVFPEKHDARSWPDAGGLERHVNRLGNATLVDAGWSQILRCYDFEAKRSGVRTRKKWLKTEGGFIGYSKSDLEINRTYLAPYERWTPDEISDREGRLARLAAEVWDLDGYLEMSEPPRGRAA